MLRRFERSRGHLTVLPRCRAARLPALQSVPCLRNESGSRHWQCPTRLHERTSIGAAVKRLFAFFTVCQTRREFVEIPMIPSLSARHLARFFFYIYRSFFLSVFSFFPFCIEPVLNADVSRVVTSRRYPNLGVTGPRFLPSFYSLAPPDVVVVVGVLVVGRCQLVNLSSARPAARVSKFVSFAETGARQQKPARFVIIYTFCPVNGV